MQGIVLRHILAVLAAALLMPSVAAGEGDLSILTFPIGLVVGEHSIDVDLGASTQPAKLYLDGEPVCSLTADRMRCVVDFGDTPHVHLLELIRLDAAGRMTASTRRWVNRAGQEAELAIQLFAGEVAAACQGTVMWSHPLKQSPVLLEIEQAGHQIPINKDGRSFTFPCPGTDEPLIVTASAIFPNGSRAEAVVASRRFGGRAEADLTATALQATDRDAAACTIVKNEFADVADPVEDADFEIVFVLVPGDGFKSLYDSGFSQVFVRDFLDLTITKPSWDRAEKALWDAARLWFVVPDERLSRMNGFERGKTNWLKSLFGIGSGKTGGPLRVADAVAASGLVAAAGPRRRAVVLVLGIEDEPDESIFSPMQARSYLAEIGVPLHVLRIGSERDDGWPSGVHVPPENIRAFARALTSIKDSLDDQCVVWLPGDLHPDQIAALLPDHLAIAGRRDGSGQSP